MRKLTTLFAMAIVLSTSAFSHAVNIRVEGPDMLVSGETAQLQVIVDILATDGPTFGIGSLGVVATSSNPSAVEFTDAEVLNPSFFGGSVGRWSGVREDPEITPGSVDDLFAVSVNSLGLSPFLSDNPLAAGGTEFLFATIDVVGGSGGVSDIQISLSGRPDPVFDAGLDISDQLTFTSLSITTVPEPTTLMLAGLSALGVVLQRRRS